MISFISFLNDVKNHRTKSRPNDVSCMVMDKMHCQPQIAETLEHFVLFTETL